MCCTIAEASTNYGGAKKSNPTLGFGRSPPSRQMVLRLGEALRVSLRERNQMLVAAGLPPAYPEGHDRPDAAGTRAVSGHGRRRLLVRGLRQPRLCRAVRRRSRRSQHGPPHDRRPGRSQAIVNWPEVAWAGLTRLRRQLDQAPLHEDLRALVSLAETAVLDLPRPATPPRDLVVCPWSRIGHEVVRTIG